MIATLFITAYTQTQAQSSYSVAFAVNQVCFGVGAAMRSKILFFRRRREMQG